MSFLSFQHLNTSSAALLVCAVLIVGVLHTIVPDHWVPITLIARQRGWTRGQTARAALQAGTGHVVTTLILAAIVWLAGVAVAAKFGHWVDTISSIALVVFGLWIAISSWLELRSGHGHGHSHGPHGHTHDFSHFVVPDGHRHAHQTAFTALQHDHPNHDRNHHHHNHGNPPIEPTSSRTALLLILGSSPMVEGIPAFFAAGKYGVSLIVIMTIVFAASTILTYVTLCVFSTTRLQRVRFGALERYGEVLSGAFIALVGLAFWLFPVL